ncbi:GNAT family N-acetyltransferase [Agrobacterium tumefaciens]|uniref:acyl-homoserine-lactone synthase n=1 Tax=Agrobacterium tumefaciens TaxID=358 RepID=UPI001572828F|nr:acyl-homoserine-lactone synthase TraI [Agrobacterium tumefaciens]MCZ7497278.1 acyl-homoserine-lactone synthase TraI [Rhizobium rhizogenes]NTE56494.1 GNAT family N-acetyltransferase [Agrobacterium tumefaciens]NTE74462.1 GNAT family N-acetyltransferase [Agrobacterium tumefaciens]
MQVTAIAKPRTASETRIIDEMHRLRARIFQGRLSWAVRCEGDREYDEFDALSPTYILALSSKGIVIGCARLLPAAGTTMLNAVFPQLLRDGRLPAHPRMIESSRFCVATDCDEGRGGGSLHTATLAMFAGIVEWCMANGYTEIATATDVRFERILSRAGWPMQRLGGPVMINETRSVAGVLPADANSFERLRPRGYNSTIPALQQKAA